MAAPLGLRVVLRPLASLFFGIPRHSVTRSRCLKGLSTAAVSSTGTAENPSISGMEYIPLDDVERLERYCPGGYHPTRLGDKLHGHRYEVIHKLGFGSNSIVWLAHDVKTQTCVAIKISAASAVTTHEESDILRMLSSKTTVPSRSSKKTMLPRILDEFDIEGPNGRHHCTVTHPARRSINDAKDPSYCRLFQPSVARAIAAQLIHGVAFLHSLGIVHGDLHTGNVLLHLPDNLTPERVVNEYGQSSSPSSELTANLLATELLSLSDACILLTDFGESFMPSRTPRYYSNTPAILRPPEVYSLPKEPVSFPADIWTLACAIYSILSQRELFEGLMPDDNWMIREHVDALGKLPPKWWDAWEGRAEWFNEHGERIDGQKRWFWEDRFEQSIRAPRKKNSIEEFGDQEERALSVMLRGMLAYDPQLRPTAGALLDSEWMRKWGIPELGRMNLELL